jgi:uncharacterized protein (TIGR02757 family)
LYPWPTAAKETIINLQQIYEDNRAGLFESADDPVEFMGRYGETSDMEIAGFLASQFAYGRIEVMKRFLRDLFGRMGASPAGYVQRGDYSNLHGLYYRFQKEEDLVRLFLVLKRILDEYGGIGVLVKAFYKGDFRASLWAIRAHLFTDSNDLTWFFPKRSDTNPLKRWNLYLRWMVRKDRIDAGIWDFIAKGDLIIPLDTHLFKIGRCLGWIGQRNQTHKAAREMTDALKRFCPDDPLKYDFFLCHRVGIEAGCKGTKSDECSARCILVTG